MRVSRQFGIVLIGLIAILLAGCGTTSTNNTPPSTPAGNSTPTPQTPPEDSKFIKSGMYKIGVDLPADEYLVISEGNGYYQVSKDSTGALESIVANDNFAGTRYVTVSEGQYLEIREAKMISAAKADPQQPEGNEYLDGMYKVGKDIPPGEYKVAAVGGNAYIEVSTNSKGSLESIVSNDNFEGEKYIKVSAGQYLKLNGCKLIK